LVEKFATLYLVLILNEGKSGFYFQKLKFEDKEKNRSDFPYFIKFFDFQRELEMIYAFDKLARDIDGYDYPLEINKEYPIKWHYFAKQFKRWFEVVFLPFLYQELKFIKQHKLEK
jgi:8-oxo-dGTP pyrophosphatase MutT (NUDIX family)